MSATIKLKVDIEDVDLNVEIKISFYQVKDSRFITHMKKHKDPRQSLNNFLGCIGQLGNKLSLILFQLPPNWHFNSGGGQVDD